MDEKYIQWLYENMGGEQTFGQYDTFRTGLQTNPEYRRYVHDSFADELDPWDDFENKVKKKEDGGPVPVGASTAGSKQAPTSMWVSGGQGRDLLGELLGPTVLLNRRQIGEYAAKGGFVASQEKGREIANEILAKPVSEEQRDIDRLTDYVAVGMDQIRTNEFERQQKLFYEQGKDKNYSDEDQRYQAISDQTATAIKELGYGDAVSFVNNALKNKDYGSIRSVINRAYGKQADEIKRKYDYDPDDDLAAIQVLKTFGWDGIADKADSEIAPLTKEKDRINFLVDRVASQDYVVNNPTIREDYEYDVVGGKPINAELSRNQYTGLRYLKDNFPEMYDQYSMELAKAANPELFGKGAYDKNNRDYQFMMYTLDKRGQQINGLALTDQLKVLDNEKRKVDNIYAARINDLSQRMMTTTDYQQRKDLQEQIRSTQVEYQGNPAIQEYNSALAGVKEAQVNFDEKYADYANRDREQMVKDILQDDGKSILGEAGNRVKWLFRNTVTGIANVAGLNDFEFGQSRNYLRNIRLAEERQAEQYQPTYQAAMQPLYKLNFSDRDYYNISAIKNSETLNKQEKADKIADYLEANADRIRYVENSEAGRSNWTWGAIGNQVADVFTQVLYQAALTYLTSRALSPVVTPAAAPAGTAVAGVAEGALAGEAGAAAQTLSARTATTALPQKLADLGSIMGSTFATTYQPAYQDALQSGKSVEEANAYANEIALVNAVTETLNPDIAVLKRAVGGVRGMNALLNAENISRATRLRTVLSNFGRGYINNVGKETLEEIAAAYGEFGVDQLHDMNQDQLNTLSQRVKNAIITTGIGMAPLGFASGVTSAVNTSRFQREQFYQAGLFPSIITAEINTLRDNNTLTGQEADRRIQLVNTMSRIINNLPVREDGRPLPDNAKVDYANNRMWIADLEQQLDRSTDNNQKAYLTNQITRLQEQNVKILRGQQAVEAPVQTETTPQEPAAGTTPAAASTTVEAPVQTEQQPAGAKYQEGDILESPEGNLEVVDQTGDVYTLRLPDGNTEQFTPQEIDELVRPRNVIRPGAAAGTQETVPGTETVDPPGQPAPSTQEQTAVPQNQPPVQPTEQQQPEPGAPPNIYIQPPGEQTGASQTVTIGEQQPVEASPATEDIVSPVNPVQDATQTQQLQESMGPELRQRESSREVTGASSEDSVQRAAGSESIQPGGAQESALIPATGEQAAIAPPAGPVADETGQQPAPEMEPDAGPVQLELAFPAETVKNIKRMRTQRLIDNILAINPDHPVRDNPGEYTRPQLQSILMGEIARSNAEQASQQAPAAAPAVPDTAPAAPAPRPESEISIATKAYNAARALVTKKQADLDAVKDTRSLDYARKKAMRDAATQKLRDAENAYAKALRNDNTKLRRQKRSLGISPDANAQRDVAIIQNYVELAKIYLRRGIRTLEGFAEKLNERVNEHMRRAWAVVNEQEAPLQNEGETYKAYLQRLRAWEQQAVNEAATRGDERTATQAREQAEEYRLGVRKMQAGIELLRSNINMPLREFNDKLGLEPDDYLTYVAALQYNIDKKTIKQRTAAQVLFALRESDPKKVVATEMQLLKMQMAATERGSRLGHAGALQEIKTLRSQVNNMLRDLYDSGLLRTGTFTQKDLVRMGAVVNSIHNEKGLDRMADFMQQLIDNSSVLQTLREVRSLQNQVARLLKSKDVITANMIRKGQVAGGRSVLEALKNVNPLGMTNLLRFNSILDNVVNSMKGKASLEISNQEIIDFLEQQERMDLQRSADNLKSRYEQTERIADSNRGGPYRVQNAWLGREFNDRVDQIMNDPDTDVAAKQSNLNALYSTIVAYEREVTTGQNNLVDMNEIYDQIKAGAYTVGTKRVKESLIPQVAAQQDFLSVALEAPDFNATEQQREWVKSIISLDLSRLTPKQLLLLKNVTDNIMVNQDFAGAQAFDVIAKAQQRSDTFHSWFAKQKDAFKMKNFKGVIGKYAESISSSDQIIMAIANNARDFATRLMDVSGLGDIKALHAQAKQVFDKELTRPLKEIYKKYRNDGLNTPESIIKRSMFAYLNESNYGTQNDLQAEFDRRKSLLEQDYLLKQTGEEDARQEAVELRKVYDQYFKNVNSLQALRSGKILNAGEQAVYDLFRDFYDRHQDQFRQTVESLLNKPFHQVENYVKDGYKSLDTGLVDADFQGMGASAFFNERNPNAPSTSTLQRQRFYRLEDIAEPSESGGVKSYRVINHAFDTVQLNSATAMLEDIYTLSARLQAEYMMSDPRLIDAIGADNTGLLRRNTEKQIKSQMNLFRRADMSFAGEFAEKFANTINQIGVRQVLFALGQLPKQFIDIFLNTTANMGKDAPMFFQALGKMTTDKASMEKLLEQSEIALRGKTFGGTNWLSQSAMNEIKQTMKRLGENAELKDADKLSFLVEGPDTWTAKAAWLAYYAQSLKRQGLAQGFGEVDWNQEAKEINREARDYAQLMTSTRLNVNSKESQSEFYSKTSGMGRLAQVLLFPLSSFNMNNYSLMYRDIQTLFSEGTQEQKLTAWRSLGSRTLAEMGFQIVRAGLTLGVKAAAGGLLSSLGIAPPDENDDEETKSKKRREWWWKVASESIKNLAFSMLGNISADVLTNGVNWLSDKAVDQPLLYQPKSNPNQPNRSFGMASILFGNYEDSKAYIRDLFGNVDADGNPVEVTPAEKFVIATAFLSNAASWFGYVPADVKQVLDQAAKQIERGKDYKDPYYFLMNNPDAKPRIKINGKDINMTDEQAEYFKAQQRYHLETLKNLTWTDQYKKTEATSRAKADLQQRYGKSLKTK